LTDITECITDVQQAYNKAQINIATTVATSCAHYCHYFRNPSFDSYCPAPGIFLTSCARSRHNMPPPPMTLTFDLLTLKMVSESRVTWATSAPILVFLGLSVLDLGRCTQQTDRRQTASSLNVPPRGRA